MTFLLFLAELADQHRVHPIADLGAAVAWWTW